MGYPVPDAGARVRAQAAEIEKILSANVIDQYVHTTWIFRLFDHSTEETKLLSSDRGTKEMKEISVDPATDKKT